MNTNDFVKGVDFTGYVQATAADLNQLVDQAQVGTDRGLLWITTDILDDSPQVPNPTGAIARGTRCIWIRKPYSANSTIKIPICYLWDDLGTSSGTYLKWIRLTAPLDNGTVGLDQINDTLAGLGLQLNVDEGLVVKLATSTISTLRNIDATNLEAGTIIFVNCHTVADDGGDGFFELRKATVTDADDDNGSKICSSAFPTFYWSRIVSGEKRYPEWFGAKGDGVTNDFAALQACLTKYNRLDLKSKTYVFDSLTHINYGLSVIDNSILSGEGVDKSILKIKDSSAAVTGSAQYYYIVANKDFYTTADDVKITGITFDCNFDNQTRKVPVAAININGSGQYICNNKFTHFGNGGPAPIGYDVELFVVLCNKLHASTYLQGPIIKDNIFCDVGNNSACTFHGAHNPEASIIGVTSDILNPSDPTYYESPVISGNIFYNIKFSNSNNKSFAHLCTFGGTRSGLITNNSGSDIGGIFVYFQAGHNFNTLISDNTFTELWCGVMIHVACNAGGKMIYDPYFYNTIIRDNTFAIITSFDNSLIPTLDPSGVYISAWDNAGGIGVTPVHEYAPYDAYIPIDGVVVENNNIKGGAIPFNANFIIPKGIGMLVHYTAYQGIVIKNNILETPAYATLPPDNTKTIGMLYEDSIVWTGYSGYWNSDLFSSKGNTSLSGRQSFIKLLKFSGYVNVFDTILDLDWYNQSAYWYPQDYPPNLSCLHFDRITKNIWMPLQVKTIVLSGSLLAGKTYTVFGSGTVAYDDGTGTVVYTTGDTFIAAIGHTTYVSGGSAYVCEHYLHCWKSLMMEDNVPRSIPITVSAGVSFYRINPDIKHLLMHGICSINFDTTNTDKIVYLPDATLYAGCRFSIIITKGATTGSRYLYLVAYNWVDDAIPTIPKVGSGVSQLATNTLGLALPLKIIGPAGSTAASYTMVEVTSDGTHWYIR